MALHRSLGILALLFMVLFVSNVGVGLAAPRRLLQLPSLPKPLPELPSLPVTLPITLPKLPVSLPSSLPLPNLPAVIPKVGLPLLPNLPGVGSRP
ncbi:hypothetical protein K2173_009134 [Erythroxylum novogranatense]|uniref:Uncharacterized protein n=1 Tax=Erythroxylum novogranatense TaxID=1862640 RepID=A0AAV8TCZ3_9ROSI|nr:hypothetical protein K2173_009134 [Erythroxylum novogranatense]